MPTESKDKLHIPFLDLARAMAAVEVVASHARPFIFVEGSKVTRPNIATKIFYYLTGFGHEAVVIFFVLSGYLVAGSIIKNSARWDRNGWFGYLTRRLSRLWIVLVPALATTAIIDLLGYYCGYSEYYHGGFQPVYHSGSIAGGFSLSFSTLMGNICFLQTICCPVFGDNGPLWSLANEFWYYALFPLAFVAFAPGRSTLVRISSGALAAALLCSLPIGIDEGFIVWLFGAALHARLLNLSKYRHSASLAALAAFLLVSALHLARTKIVSNFPAELAIGLSFAAILALLPREGLIYRYRNAFIEDISSFSYTLYLFHFPFCAFAVCLLLKNRVIQPSISAFLLFIALISVCLGISKLLYFVFERNTSTLRQWMDRLIQT